MSIVVDGINKLVVQVARLLNVNNNEGSLTPW